MSEATLSPKTAPRDRGALMQISPFKLRFLVQELGGLNDDGQKMAWHGLKTREAQVDYALTYLQHWDTANPGQAAPQQAAPPQQQAPAPQQTAPMQQAPMQNGATPHQPGPVPGGQYQNPYPVAPMVPGAMAGFAGGQPMMGAPQPPPVSQAAMQQAQDATSDAGKPKRAPRTPAAPTSAGAPSDFGMEVVNLLTGISAKLETQNAGLDTFQKNIVAALTEAANSKTSRVDAVEAQQAQLTEALRQQNLYLQSISNVQLWSIMMLLTFMQENMGLPSVQVLKAAIDDSPMFSKMVDQATGKA